MNMKECQFFIFSRGLIKGLAVIGQEKAIYTTKINKNMLKTKRKNIES